MFNLSELDKETEIRELRVVTTSQQSRLMGAPSPFKERYLQEMAGVSSQAEAALTISSTLYPNHQILYDPASRWRQDVRVMIIERSGSVITYQVGIGSFLVEVKMLNVIRSPDVEEIKLAQGSFGQIFLQRGQHSQFVCKRIPFLQSIRVAKEQQDGIDWSIKANFSQLRCVLVEYAMAKISSLFNISAPILTPYGFDIICYRDHVQFYMERCYPGKCHPHIQDARLIERRLKYCLRVMHFLNIVHNDIKPQNILYSKTVNDIVLCDFGISRFISEEVGERSQTWMIGTWKYMGQEMRGIKSGEEGLVDLYYNDLHCLKMCLPELVDSSQPADTLSSFSKRTEGKRLLFRALYDIYRNGRSAYKELEDLEQFTHHFPELNSASTLFPSTSLPLDVEYLVSSIPFFDGECEYYLGQCDQTDPKTRAILTRISKSKRLAASQFHDNSARQRYRRRRMLLRDLRILKAYAPSEATYKRLGRVAVELFQHYLLNDVFPHHATFREQCQQLVHLMQRIQPKCQDQSLREEFLVCVLQLKIAFSASTAEDYRVVGQNYQKWSFQQLRIFEHHLSKQGPTQLVCSILERIAVLMPRDWKELSRTHIAIGFCKRKLEGQQARLRYFQQLFESINLKDRPQQWCVAGMLLAEELMQVDLYRSTALLYECQSKVSGKCRSQLLVNLGSNFRTCRSYTEALQCYQLAAKLISQSQGESLEYLIVQKQIGALHGHLHHYQLGLKILYRVLGKMRTLLSPYDPLTVSTHVELIQILSYQGQLDKAISELTSLRRVISPTGTISLTSLIWHMATFEAYQVSLERPLKKSEAKRLLGEVHPIVESFLERWKLDAQGKKDDALVSYFMILARHFMLMQDWSRARQFLLKAFEYSPAESIGFAELMERLCFCEVKLGMIQQAQTRLVSIRSVNPAKVQKISAKAYWQLRYWQYYRQAKICEILREESEACMTVSNLSAHLATRPSRMQGTELYRLGRLYFGAKWYKLAQQLFQLQQEIAAMAQIPYRIACCMLE